MRSPFPNARQQRVVGLLDLGSSKIGCLIVAVTDEGANSGQRVRVLGFGCTRSHGIKAGTVVDIVKAEAAVRTAVAQAEREAGVILESLMVAVSCGRLKSHAFAAHAEITASAVTQNDVNRVFAGGRAYVERDGRQLLHMNRIGFRLDREVAVEDPRGLSAQRLSADLHAVTADEAALQNVALLLDNCHLRVDGLVATPQAAGLAAAHDEERAHGVAVIDLGAGVTTTSMFLDGRLQFVDAVAFGWSHLTRDIATGLSTSLAEAERIKALKGSLIVARSDAYEVFTYPLANERDGDMGRATKAELTQLIAPRALEILTQVRARMMECGLMDTAGRRIVLTGGGAQLAGIGTFAADVFNVPVRIGAAAVLDGAPPQMAAPSFSVLGGLAQISAQGTLGRGRGGGPAGLVAHTQPYAERVKRWLVGA